MNKICIMATYTPLSLSLALKTHILSQCTAKLKRLAGKSSSAKNKRESGRQS